MSLCPASYEAVLECVEEDGATGCPICGKQPEAHPSESLIDYADQDER